jgi:hypothetical protein
VIDAQDKLTALIRHAIEDEAKLELVTRPGEPTPRGGYDTTRMFAQNGTATAMTIEAAWYPGSASFTLAGPAVDQAEEAFWTDRGLRRSRNRVTHGPLQCHLYVPYADGSRVDQLLAVLPALAAGYHAGAAAANARAAQGQAQENPVDSLEAPDRDEPAAPVRGGGHDFPAPAGRPAEHRGGDAADAASPAMPAAAAPHEDNWQPAYEPWRHGGWYVTNVRYPSGACGCVSRNYGDRKWRIACDPRPDAHEKYTFRTRDAAARAERELTRTMWERVAGLAAGLAPVTGPGTTPNTTDAPCAACGTVVKAGKGLEIPGAGMPPALLDSACSGAVGREQDDPGGSRVAPDGYAQLPREVSSAAVTDSTTFPRAPGRVTAPPPPGPAPGTASSRRRPGSTTRDLLSRPGTRL